MIRIEDGRAEFWQWDVNRKLIINEPTATEIHFCNRSDDCSLVCEIYEENGVRLANVPNVLLQESWPIKVYAYCGDKYTKISQTFKVNARSKPEDYIHTEEELLTWEQLNERIDEIEKNGISDEAVEAAVGKYLDENPIETGATEQEAAQIEQNKNDIAMINKTMATTEYVDKAVENVDVDLTGYATEKYVDDAIAAIDIPEGGDTASVKEIAISTSAPTDENVVLWIDPSDNGEDFATKAYANERDGVTLTAAKDYAKDYTDTKVSGFTTMAAVEAKGYTTMAAVEQKGYQTEAQVNALINTALGVIENGSY